MSAKWWVWWLGVNLVNIAGSLDPNQRSYHFVGVGGVGMSALAYVLVKRGYQVSGSDLATNARTQRLASLGAQIHQDHSIDHIAGSPCVIYSSAVKPSNPEITAALDQGLPLCHRATLLAHLFNTSYGIGVAGTHGKTTTSSMIGYLLVQAQLDPTLVIGGEVDAWGGNARVGQSHYMVAEVDESDGSLVQLHPTIGVITNIELDHPDHYADLGQVIAAFQQYEQQCEVVVASLDCETVAQSLNPHISYSLIDHPKAHYLARSIKYNGSGTTAQIWEHGIPLGTLTLQVLGAHNLSNALAAIAVGRHLGLDFKVIAGALQGFVGAHRRFELKGQVGDVIFIDDYAHHPSEIEVTLKAAKLRERRVVAVFQPHRYSRLTSLFEDFTHAFAQADVVVITSTYAAGESPQGSASSLTLAAAIAQYHTAVWYEPSLDALPEHLARRVEPSDLVLFLGAGNLNQQIPQTMAVYRDLLQSSQTVEVMSR